MREHISVVVSHPVVVVWCSDPETKTDGVKKDCKNRKTMAAKLKSFAYSS